MGEDWSEIIVYLGKVSATLYKCTYCIYLYSSYAQFHLIWPSCFIIASIHHSHFLAQSACWHAPGRAISIRCTLLVFYLIILNISFCGWHITFTQESFLHSKHQSTLQKVFDLFSIKKDNIIFTQCTSVLNLIIWIY